MKQILTILLLLPLCVFAQSHESKQLYKQGIELLDAEKYEEALTYFQKSDSLDKAILKPTHNNYYRAELAMADCYGQADDEGHYNEALNIQKNVVEIRKKVLGDTHPDYAISLSNLAGDHRKNGNYDTATYYYKQCYHCLNSFILKTFASLTTKERNDFWKTKSFLFTKALPYKSLLQTKTRPRNPRRPLPNLARKPRNGC